LYITPAFYVAMEHLSERLRRRAALRQQAMPEIPAGK
jgi:hypothetical protein